LKGFLMNKKNVSWLIGAAAAMVVTGASFLAVSGMVYGLENESLATTLAPRTQAHVLVAQAEGTPVSYTADQAERGKKVFSEDCVECHGKDLRGGLLGGPPLRGQSFEQKYAKGAPAGQLFEVMSGTMPPNAPGSYSANVYADLMAYVLKTNGYKAGAELPSDVDALYNLTIEK
jgi:mono/diheme cytochrome c family protein